MGFFAAASTEKAVLVSRVYSSIADLVYKLRRWREKLVVGCYGKEASWCSKEGDGDARCRYTSQCEQLSGWIPGAQSYSSHFFAAIAGCNTRKYGMTRMEKCQRSFANKVLKDGSFCPVVLPPCFSIRGAVSVTLLHTLQCVAISVSFFADKRESSSSLSLPSAS